MFSITKWPQFYLFFLLHFITKAAIESVGNNPLSSVLKEFGGWPVIEGDDWDESKFDWLDLLIAFRKKGFSHDLFYDLSVTPDFRDNKRHIIDVSQTMAGFYYFPFFIYHFHLHLHFILLARRLMVREGKMLMCAVCVLCVLFVTKLLFNLCR